MNTTIERKQQASFRLRASLMERLRAEARYEHRSLTDLVEILLDEALKHRPNPETMAAIEEARSGKYAGTIDASSFESFMKSINEIE
ncbi:toxin-antitoxin system protein [Parabacteroides sp. An277]|uniref:toxin-antitoxin system protein n=1 Tax=Parabacteroides sp. An277 TaxID=1965619 RepID=UPI000B39D39E|nr:toxin-antitoxin system protein [Parabacteroides sp. An277]OUO50231.1 toxin-antitoxin system protein [Parabacteroides sp. An277]